MSLNIENLTKKFGKTKAVNQLNLNIEKGQMFGMLGANGAGKTTTFRMILSLLEPTSGCITWSNEKINYKTSQLIGYLPEERGLYPKLKVAEQLVYLGRLRGMEKKDILTEMHEWLERFKVPENANKLIEELSKGNQQKIQFIASVIHRPELLILDEPFSGLDPVNVELLKEAVLDLNKSGTTIVFSSHRMEHVEELCEQLCILHHGTPVVEGRLRDVKKSFGKMNVVIRADFPLDFLDQFAGVLKVKHTKEGAVVQIANEDTAHQLFQVLATKGFVRKFEIEDPSLHDIFLEKVGAHYE
ncbi:ABC transporter ATP-binding protein [Alkalihalobacterium alkalinitrilicum]|uniref:ABC transporter ATP-binding protein n=1 Tax=Alkalihalobacterium alkalinitrilicum TaxID=427920 RepID=UPI000995437D|nr:ABC transporter ATP-binding protein [Alkalihalobacterium alkalinitrilicum]